MGQTVLQLDVPDAGSASHDNKASELVRLKPGYSFKPDAGSGNVMHAFIDPSIINETDYADQLYGGGGESWPPPIDQSKAVGFTHGSHSVTPTGAAAYDIPIQLPPGTAGIAPSLSISYNSQSGNGLLGMGWNIAGLSAISRVPNTIYHNEAVKGVRLDHTDAFALDGNRLIKISGDEFCVNSCVYGTEQETFSQITSYGYYGSPDGSVTDGGPEWFEVKTKEGMILHYGNSDDSRFWTGDGSKVIVYRINKMIDQYGNYVTFKYRNIDRQSVIEEIRYTGNDNANVQPYNVIQFEYGERQDKNTVYVNGFYSDVKSNLLLRKIRIIADGQHFKNYEFEYGLNLYSFLKSVTESGANGEELNSTVMRYGNLPDDAILVTEREIFVNQDLDIFTGDFNGDGLTDIVTAAKQELEHYTRHTHLRLYLNMGDENGIFWTGGTLERDLSMHYYQVQGANDKIIGFYYNLLGMATGDYTGDGRDDLVLIDLKDDYGVDLDKIMVYSYSWPYNFDVTNYLPPPTHTGTVYGKNVFFPGDFDGDGSMDYITFTGDGSGVTGFVSYIGTGNFNRVIYGEGFTPYAGMVNQADKILVVDHNGDGKHDLMVIEGDNTIIYSFSLQGNLVIPEVIYSSGFPSAWHHLFPGDFNGDGKTDLLTLVGDNDWHISYSNGLGYYGQHPFLFNVTPGFLDLERVGLALQRVIIGDYNGDGKTDILHARAGDPADLTVYYSTGEGFLRQDNEVGGVPILDYHKILQGDFNGDGKTDLLSRAQYHPVRFIFFNKNSQEFLLGQVTDGITRTVTFEYGMLSQNVSNSSDYYWYWHGTNAQFPICDFSGSLAVVRRMSEPSGNGGLFESSFKYQHGKIHKHGKGFLGFTKIEIVGGSAAKRIFDYEIEPQTHNLGLKELTTSMEIGFQSSKVTYNNEVIQLGDRFLTRPLSTTLIESASNSTTVTNYNTYDDYGNPTQITTTKGSETAVANTQFIAFGDWHVPSRTLYSTTTVTRDGDSDSKPVSYTYNDKGSPLTEITDLGMPKSVTKTFVYDDFGNTESLTVSATSLPSQLTSFKYDPKGRFAIRTTNSIGQHSHATYDGRWGKPITVTAITGHVGTYEYDAFGRQKQATNPMGISATTTLHWDISAEGGAVYRTETQALGTPSEKIWHDAFGHELKRETQGLGQQTITTLHTYDHWGRSASAIGPHSSNNGIETTYGYDSYGRPKSVTTPIGTTSYSYTPSGGTLTTTVTAPGIPSRNTVSDASGKVISASDAGGTLDFTYYGSGNPKATTMGQHQLVGMTYDPYGRQTSLSDLNSGLSGYEYDAYGQLKVQSDANDNVHQMEYDILGRITERSGPDGTVTYQYVTSGNGLNQVSRVSMDNGTMQEFTYDTYNRVVSQKEIIEDKEFTTSYTYNELGKMASITYPTGFTITQGYDANGYLTTVNHNGTEIFKAEAANAYGLLTDYTLGSGKTTSKIYNNLGQLHIISTEDVLELGYDFEPETSNLLKRQDIRRGLEEVFEHDGLSRLKKVEVNGTVLLPLEVDYDPNGYGNIVEKSDAGEYTYLSDKIHAVKTITNPDVNISQETQIIEYTAQGRRTKSIFEGLHLATFTYGPDNSRKKMVTTEGAQTTTRYYQGNYEELIIDNGNGNVNTYNIHYIGGGDGMCAIYVTLNGGQGEFYYIYKDHLGSLLAITDSEGDLVAEQSFDAWGRYRSTDNWGSTSGPDEEWPEWLSLGYTGHEHLPQFALVNMNGRMYDPLQGRMLAPDNFIQDPFSTQSYNRYSYVWNNPMVHVDPSGEMVWFAPILIGAVMGATLNVIIQGFAGNLEHATLGDAAEYMAVGALAGAASGGLGIALSGSMAIGGVVGGVMNGAITGGVSSFIAETGNAMVSGGANFENAMEAGALGSLYGAASGAVIGGLAGGLGALAEGNHFWTGKEVEVGRNPFSLNNKPRPASDMFYVRSSKNGGVSVISADEAYRGLDKGKMSQEIQNSIKGELPQEKILYPVQRAHGKIQVTYEGLVANGETLTISKGNGAEILNLGGGYYNSTTFGTYNAGAMHIGMTGAPSVGEVIIRLPFNTQVLMYIPKGR